jgi:SpoIID/LytB domain protein
MCQWGAKGMAEQGATARQILEFYYPGATFATLTTR